ncbi:MAG: ABC transporter substrate-binding protein [Micromonosporaceae bacterium]
MHRSWGVKRRLAALITVIVAAGTAVAGCGGGAGDGSDNRLVVAQSSDVLSLDPSVDISPISLNVFMNIYDQLTRISRDGKVEPLLATKWESSEDLATWTFTIRRDATFSNGKPVAVEDVVWSYEKVMEDVKSPARPYLTPVKTVEKVAADQVRFTLKGPFSSFDRQASLISILPQQAYQEAGAEKFAENPIGSGPYRFVSWKKDSQLVLHARKNYFAGAPKIRTVVFKPVPSANTREAGLLSGELDVVPLLPPPSVPEIRKSGEVKIKTVTSNRVLYLGFNTRQAPLNDVRLRRAIDYAIDRKAITKDLLSGLGKPAGQLVAPVTFGYDSAVKPTPYEPERAKRLVRASSYDGEPVVFQFPNNRYSLGVEVAQAVGGYLKEAGIEVTMEGMEYSAFFPLWAERKLEGMHMFAFGPTTLDAELVLSALYASGSQGYLASKQTDALISAERAAADPAVRKREIARIWRLSKRQAAYLPLYNELQAYGIAKNVKWQPRPDERLLFVDAELKKN